MRVRSSPSWWVAVPLLLAAPSPHAHGGVPVTVRVEDVRNETGLLRIALFEGSDGFPDRAERAVDTASVAPRGRTVEFRFDDVEPGTLAVVVLHDENLNGRLDRNFLRIPKEGVGASNDAARNGPPRFDDARVAIPPDGATLTIRLRYWR